MIAVGAGPSDGIIYRRFAQALAVYGNGEAAMAVREPPYTKDEYARRGIEIYERSIKPVAEAGNEGKLVALDIETGDWEMDSDDFTATERLLNRKPDAQIWLQRVGFSATYRVGGSRRPGGTS
jgi:hypothetical protein